MSKGVNLADQVVTIHSLLRWVSDQVVQDQDLLVADSHTQLDVYILEM